MTRPELTFIFGCAVAAFVVTVIVVERRERRAGR